MGPLIGAHHAFAILEVKERLPRGIMERVALPLHEVLDARAMQALLQNGLHFILGFTISEERRGWGRCEGGERSGRRWGRCKGEACSPGKCVNLH